MLSWDYGNQRAIVLKIFTKASKKAWLRHMQLPAGTEAIGMLPGGAQSAEPWSSQAVNGGYAKQPGPGKKIIREWLQEKIRSITLTNMRKHDTTLRKQKQRYC